MSDELDEELRRASVERLSAGAVSPPLREAEIDHLVDLWQQQRADVVSAAKFAARVYRAAQQRARRDDRAEQIRRNTALSKRLKRPGHVPGIADVQRHVRDRAAASLDVPGPRAAQLADELDRLTLSILQLWSMLLRLLTLVHAYRYRYIEARRQDHNDLSDALGIGRGELEWHKLIGVVRYRELARLGSDLFDDLLGALGWSRVPAEMVPATAERALAEVIRRGNAETLLRRDLQRLQDMVRAGDTDKAVDTLKGWQG